MWFHRFFFYKKLKKKQAGNYFTLYFFSSRFPENPPISFAIPDWQLKSGASNETNNNEQKTEIVTNGLDAKESKPEQHQQQVLDPDLVSQIDWYTRLEKNK